MILMHLNLLIRVSCEVALTELIHTFIELIVLLVPSLSLKLLRFILSNCVKRFSWDILKLLFWRWNCIQIGWITCEWLIRNVILVSYFCVCFKINWASCWVKTLLLQLLGSFWNEIVWLKPDHFNTLLNSVALIFKFCKSIHDVVSVFWLVLLFKSMDFWRMLFNDWHIIWCFADIWRLSYLNFRIFKRSEFMLCSLLFFILWHKNFMWWNLWRIFISRKVLLVNFFWMHINFMLWNVFNRYMRLWLLLNLYSLRLQILLFLMLSWRFLLIYDLRWLWRKCWCLLFWFWNWGLISFLLFIIC